jgi:hypothetical protein
MITWSHFEHAAPAFAAEVRALFDAGRHKTLATLRADGSPRISGIECQIADGELRFGSMAGSRKGADLARDPRFAIHSPTFHPDDGKESEWPGEAKVEGRARKTGSLPGTREDDQPDGTLFAADIDEVVITHLDPDASKLVIELWTPTGIERSSDSRSVLRIGIAHHLGWAVVVSASSDHHVVDRRRLELIDSGLPAAPIHHIGGPHALHRQGNLDDEALKELVAEVRASVERMTAAALDELASDLPAPIESISLRAWPQDFPDDITVLRRAPYESQADSVMYRQVLAEVAHDQQWKLHLYNAKNVESEAAHILRDRAQHVLHGPRQQIGSPWNKDHRTALAATILAEAAQYRE